MLIIVNPPLEDKVDSLTLLKKLKILGVDRETMEIILKECLDIEKITDEILKHKEFEYFTINTNTKSFEVFMFGPRGYVGEGDWGTLVVSEIKK